MQLRLAATATKAIRVYSGSRYLNLCRVFSGRSRTADPSIFQGEVDVGPDVHRSNPEGAEKSGIKAKVLKKQVEQFSKDKNPLEPPTLPHASAKLRSTGVNERLDPNIQQKRSDHDATAARVEEVVCVSFDGSPWPEEKEQEQEQRDVEEKQEDDMEYYKHHKASPLSEIEMADTRKPITRATDGTAGTEEYGVGQDAIGWRPEQLDTAEDSLRRATEIWKQNAMRGDPDAPHSRVLRALRGESF